MTNFLLGLFAGGILVVVLLNYNPVASLIINAEGSNTETRFIVDCKIIGDEDVRCQPVGKTDQPRLPKSIGNHNVD